MKKLLFIFIFFNGFSFIKSSEAYLQIRVKGVEAQNLYRKLCIEIVDFEMIVADYLKKWPIKYTGGDNVKITKIKSIEPDNITKVGIDNYHYIKFAVCKVIGSFVVKIEKKEDKKIATKVEYQPNFIMVIK